MRRLPVAFQRDSEADLADIFRVVLNASQDQAVAEGFIRRIIARCRRMRTVSFERSAIIAYRVEAGRVTITNVFYGGRDVEALYRKDQPDDEPAP